jgi:hypothetical protein
MRRDVDKLCAELMRLHSGRLTPASTPANEASAN